MSNDNLETKSDQICPLNVTLKTVNVSQCIEQQTSSQILWQYAEKGEPRLCA